MEEKKITRAKAIRLKCLTAAVEVMQKSETALSKIARCGGIGWVEKKRA